MVIQTNPSIASCQFTPPSLKTDLMPKKPFVPRGLTENGFPSIGSLSQYLYEYFNGESRFAQKVSVELRERALSSLKQIAEKRGMLWISPSVEKFSHEENALIESRAYQWVAELFHDFSVGENLLENSCPIDFNEAFSLSILPSLSALLRSIRDEMERGVLGALGQDSISIAEEPLKGMCTEIDFNYVKLTLAKIKIIRDYENFWNDLFICGAKSRGYGPRSENQQP